MDPNLNNSEQKEYLPLKHKKVRLQNAACGLYCTPSYSSAPNTAGALQIHESNKIMNIVKKGLHSRCCVYTLEVEL